MKFSKVVPGKTRFFGALIFLFTICSPAAAAYGDVGIYTSDNLFGQTQSYDVLLRGNGEAIVDARINYTNNGDSAVSKLAYTLANGKLTDISAYQEITCSELPIILNPLAGTDSTKSSTPGTISPSAASPGYVSSTDIPECYPSLKEHPLASGQQSVASPYSNTVQPSYYYPGSSLLYKKVSVQQSATGFTLTLPQSVEVNKSVTIVAAYDLTGIAHKKQGAYAYDFKTLKTNDRVSDVTVAISVDDGYYLDGVGKSKVNYRPATSDVGSSLMAGTNIASSADSSAVNNYVDSIGQNGSISKHASRLEANESFTVSGRYASSTFLLHWPRTILRWTIFAVVIAGIIIWIKRRSKRNPPTAPDTKDESKPASSEPDALSSADTSVSKIEATKTEEPKLIPAKLVAVNGRNIHIHYKSLPFYRQGSGFANYLRERRLRSSFFGWLCSLLATVLLTGVIFAVNMISSLEYSGNQSANPYLVEGLFVCLLVVGIIGTLALTIGLPILYSKNVKNCLYIITHVVLFFIVIGAVLFYFTWHASNSPTPDYQGCGYSSYYGAVNDCVQPL